MRKMYIFFLGCMLFSMPSFAQQQILLLVENFEDGGSSFLYDSLGPSGQSVGDNNFIINNAYSGGGVYVNTPPQDSVVLGSITNAPNSTYLHIHDVNQPSGVANANWNPNSVSDRFTYIGDGFCTLGITNVVFTFFWMCNGDGVNSYGELYYSIDGGTWTQAGPRLYGQNKWKYESIQLPAFSNVSNVRFGFRWVNAAGTSSNISLAIDDIICVGTYDNINNPAEIVIDSITPNSLCQGGFVLVYYSLSVPLCSGVYLIELSDNAGNFPGPYGDYVLNVPSGALNGITAIPVPGNLNTNCFRVRIVRNSPLPQIIGEASACVQVIDCPENIFNVTAPVMNDGDTTCVLSVIDVKFNSTGVFLNNNVYRAQLSNANGSFANPYQLGQLASNDSFPNIPQPGNISGIIPQTVPEGCGYYIRVVSSNPNVVGDTIGPFCIVHCDMLTNNSTDIRFCITELVGDTVAIQINVNYFDSLADYAQNNQFIVELRSMMNFSLVNSGGLGVFLNNADATLQIVVPPLPQLLALGLTARSYYMRIVANGSTVPWDQTGTVIRLTIGAPSAFPPTIVPSDTAFCSGRVIDFLIVPFNPNNFSPPPQYQWNIPQLVNNGQWFTWPFNPLSFDFTNVNPANYNFYVREVHNGCFGPASAPRKVYLIPPPTVNIEGPPQVCIGDTVTYDVDYLPETFYDWSVTNGITFNESNSQVQVVFDSLGLVTVYNYSLNECGDSLGMFETRVVTLFNVDAGPDQSVCAGQPVQFTASSQGVDRVLQSNINFRDSSAGYMFNLIAHQNLVIDSIAAIFKTDSFSVETYARQGGFIGVENQPASWSSLPGAYLTSLFVPGTFQVIPGNLNWAMSPGDTAGFYVTVAYGGSASGYKMVDTAVNLPRGSVWRSDGTLDFTTGVKCGYLFNYIPGGAGSRVPCIRIYYSTADGLSYIWSTGDSTPTLNIIPTQNEEYRVLVLDTSGCKNYDTVLVEVRSYPQLELGQDTLICKGDPYQINATSTATNFNWSPADGISATNVLSPVFQSTVSQTYTVTAWDAANCPVYDTLSIEVENCSSYIHIPQAFSPNGDGINDHFTLFTNNIAEYEIRIFNRWGEMVYRSGDLQETNNLDKGWDGFYRGEAQNAGVFVYYLIGKTNNGETIERKGDITLIR